MLMKKACYPSCMVPYTGLNPDVNVDELLTHGDFSVARRVDREFSADDIRRMSDNTCIVRADSTLRDETISRIPNLSTTMLRLSFPLQAVMLDVKMKSPDDNWKGGMINARRFCGRAIKPKASYLMVYKAKLIHRKPVDYQRKFERREEAIPVQNCYDGLEEDIVKSKFTKSKFYHGFGLMWLKHSPTKLNYWHYELKLENSEGKLIKDAKYKPVDDAEKRNMKQSFIEYVWDNYLYKHFWVDMNPCKADIAMSHFYDGRVCFARRLAASYLTKCLFGIVPIVAR